MDTLCTTQKQTNLTNSLLQDIAIFNEHDSTKLEEWLMDIETTENLTNESQVKLAKAKSRGITNMLVMETINSEKNDLLRLKLCNANIHTYASCFMDVQWTEESTAAYVHQFKTEAKWCNFTNDVATIRIFVKWLKNAHSVAAGIYVKDPQTLKYTITEVEKLICGSVIGRRATSPWVILTVTPVSMALWMGSWWSWWWCLSWWLF